MRELHIVFTRLNVLRKLIDGGGLDQAFQEAVKLITFHYSRFLYEFYTLGQTNSNLIFKVNGRFINKMGRGYILAKKALIN